MPVDLAADVAVIIPTVASNNLLERALRSVESQTIAPSEVVVVVDAPDRVDEVVKRLESFSGQFRRLRVLTTEGGRGPSHARNVGAASASASYLAFLDDDDEFVPGKLELVQKYFGRADLIFHGLRWIVEGINLEFEQRPGAPRLPDLLIENTIGPPTAVVVRRATFQKVGGFREDLPALEDFELWLRLVVDNVAAVVLDVALARYAVALQSGSRSSNTKNDRRAWESVHRIYAKQYAALGMRQRAQHRQYIYRGRMHRNRGAGRRWRAAAWAALAACAYPSRRSIALTANAITLPFLGFGSRELLRRLGARFRGMAQMVRPKGGNSANQQRP